MLRECGRISALLLLLALPASVDGQSWRAAAGAVCEHTGSVTKDPCTDDPTVNVGVVAAGWGYYSQTPFGFKLILAHARAAHDGEDWRGWSHYAGTVQSGEDLVFHPLTSNIGNQENSAREIMLKLSVWEFQDQSCDGLYTVSRGYTDTNSLVLSSGEVMACMSDGKLDCDGVYSDPIAGCHRSDVVFSEAHTGSDR